MIIIILNYILLDYLKKLRTILSEGRYGYPNYIIGHDSLKSKQK
jgi:hypothetical protein